MLAINATTARNEWSSLVETVIREKPAIIKKTRDYLFFSNMNVLENILSAYSFNAETMIEDDGSVTISLNEIELVENAPNKQEAILKLAQAILEYSKDYYNEFSYWSRGDRKTHVPYIFKALILNDISKIGGLIKCHRGKN